MDLQEHLLKEYSERLEMLTRSVAKGDCASYEDYKYMCGQIRGLESACFVIKDLQTTTEIDDE